MHPSVGGHNELKLLLFLVTKVMPSYTVLTMMYHIENNLVYGLLSSSV